MGGAAEVQASIQIEIHSARPHRLGSSYVFAHRRFESASSCCGCKAIDSKQASHDKSLLPYLDCGGVWLVADTMDTRVSRRRRNQGRGWTLPVVSSNLNFMAPPTPRPGGSSADLLTVG